MLVISSIVALDLLALYYVLFEFFFHFLLFGDLRLFTRRKHDEIPRQLPVSACVLRWDDDDDGVCVCHATVLLQRVSQKGDPGGVKRIGVTC